MKKFAFLLFFVFISLTINTANAQSSSSNQTEYLFVMQAENGYIKNNKLFLNNTISNTIYLSDRPYKIAGHIETQKFISSWNQNRNFENDRPNIVVSFKDKKLNRYIDVTLEVSNPQVTGFGDKDLTFDIDSILESDVKIEKNEKIKFNYPSLFIDGYGCWVLGC